MLFGLVLVLSIVVGSVIFSILSIGIDNLGDKWIESIDRRRREAL